MWQFKSKDPNSCPYYGEDRHKLRVLLESKDRDEEQALWEFIKRSHLLLYENLENINSEAQCFPLEKPTFPLTPLEVFQKSPPLLRRKIFFQSLERGDIFYLKVIKEEFDCYKLLAIDKYKGCMKIDDLSIKMELPKLPQEVKHLFPFSFSIIRAALSSCNVKERTLCVTFDQSVVKEEFREVTLGPVYEKFSPHYLGTPFLGISLTDNLFMTGDIRLRNRLPEFSIIGIDENKVYSHNKKINGRKLSPLLTRSSLKQHHDRATSTSYFNLAVASLQKSRTKQALSHLKLALYLWNEYPEALLLAGKCYNIIGDTPNAFMCTMKVYESYPNVSAARKQMCVMLVDAANVHLSYNNKSLARESLEMARIIDPENENAKRLLFESELLNNNSSLIKPDEKYGIPNPFEEEINVTDDISVRPKRKHHKKKACKTKHDKSKHQRHHHRSSKLPPSQEIIFDQNSPSFQSNLQSRLSNIQSILRQQSNNSPTGSSSSNETLKSMMELAEKNAALEIEFQNPQKAAKLIQSSDDSSIINTLITTTSKLISSIQDLAKQSGNPLQPPDNNPLSQYSFENLAELERIKNQCINPPFKQLANMPDLATILQSHFLGTPNLIPPQNEIPMHSDIQWKVPAIPFLEPSLVENQTQPHSINAVPVTESKQSMESSYHSDLSQGQLQIETNCLQSTSYKTLYKQPESPDRSQIPNFHEDKKTSDQKPYLQSTPTPSSNKLFKNPLSTNLKTKYFKPISLGANQSLSSSSNVVQTSKNTQNVHNAEPSSSSNANQVIVKSDVDKSPESPFGRRTPKRYRTIPPKKYCKNSSPTRYRKSSPKRYKSRSPKRSKSRSPKRHRICSPKRFRSSFKEASLSPKRSKSRSPISRGRSRVKRSRSHSRKRSRSHSRKRSRSHSRKRSRSHSRKRSRSHSRKRSRSGSRKRSGSHSRKRSRSRSQKRSRSCSRKQSRSISPPRGHRSDKSHLKRSKYKTSYQKSFASLPLHSQRHLHPIKKERGSPLSYEMSNSNISDVVVSSPSFSNSSCEFEPNSPHRADLFKHNPPEPHLVGESPDMLKKAQFGRSESPPWQRHVSIVTKPDKPKDYSSPTSDAFSSRQRFIKREPSPERSIPVICTRVVSYK